MCQCSGGAAQSNTAPAGWQGAATSSARPGWGIAVGEPAPTMTTRTANVSASLSLGWLEVLLLVLAAWFFLFRN